MTRTPPKSEDIGRRTETRRYVIGAALTVALTLAAFGIVAADLLARSGTILAVAALAAVQIVVHFRYFLHIDLKRSHRDDLLLILFTGLIITLMVAGSLWILYDQWARMMPGP